MQISLPFDRRNTTRHHLQSLHQEAKFVEISLLIDLSIPYVRKLLEVGPQHMFVALKTILKKVA